MITWTSKEKEEDEMIMISKLLRLPQFVGQHLYKCVKSVETASRMKIGRCKSFGGQTGTRIGLRSSLSIEYV